MSNYVNYDDVVSQLQSIGLIIDGPLKLATGKKSVRCKVGGEGKEKRGWYRLYKWITRSGEVFLTGNYGVFYGDVSNTCKIELTKECVACHAQIGLKEKTCPSCGKDSFKKREFSDEEKAAFRARIAEDKKRAEEERNAEIAAKAKWATAVWRACREAQPGEHDYLVRKGLAGTGGARIFESNDGIMLEGDKDELKEVYKYLATFHGALVVPLCDEHGVVYGLQFILSRQIHGERIRATGRDKEYWPAGMGVEGHYWLIGGTPRGLMLSAEGFATGLRLHNATGLPVAIAFAANNLGPVAKQLAKRFRKRVRNLICADDDWLQKCKGCSKYTAVTGDNCTHCGQPHGKINAGITRAQEAAIAVEGCAWVAPKFSIERPADRKGPTDFDDLAAAEGMQVVTAQIEAKLDELGWKAPASASQSAPRAGISTQGGGGSRERNAAVAVMDLDSAIERFVPLDDGSGDVLFDSWTNKIVKVKQMVGLLQAGVRWDDVKRHYRWIERGAFYLDQVGFDPAGEDGNVKLNTWRGWPLVAKQGKCDLLLELLQYLCSLEKNSEELYQWLLCWMAYPLQNPGAKMSSAVIMHGPQGTGKSTIFQTLARIYGDYATVLNQRGLEDKFNADWVDAKLFILAEEVVTRAEMWHIKNELKELITGEWVRVNGKFAGAYRQRNHINAAFLSNEGQPLPLENDDRRHCVVWTPPELGQEFYDDVREEIEDGGVEAFYHFLLQVDCSKFHAKKRPPETQAKRNLIDLSRPSEERFLIDWINGDITFNDDAGALPFCACGTTDLYSAYLKWCRQQGEFRPRALNVFIGSLTRRTGWAGQHRDRWNSDTAPVKKLRQRMIEPSDADIARHIKANGDDHRQKTDETAVAWATRCFFRFRQALGGDQ